MLLFIIKYHNYLWKEEPVWGIKASLCPSYEEYVNVTDIHVYYSYCINKWFSELKGPRKYWINLIFTHTPHQWRNYGGGGGAR